MGRNKITRDHLTKIGKLGINETFFYTHLDEQPNGCQNWTASQHVQGYGMMNIYDFERQKNRMTVAHRVAMMLHLNRELVHDDFVIHTCNNPLCCNHQHMILGDYHVQREVMMSNGNMKKRLGPRPRPPKQQSGRTYK